MATFRPTFSGYNEPEPSSYFVSGRKNVPRKEVTYSSEGKVLEVIEIGGGFTAGISAAVSLSGTTLVVRRGKSGHIVVHDLGSGRQRAEKLSLPKGEGFFGGGEIVRMRKVIDLITNADDRSPQAKKTSAKAAEGLTSVVDDLVKLRVQQAMSEAGLFQQIVEEAPSPEPINHTPGYEAAVESGAEFRTRIFKSEEMMSSDALARLLGVSRETVNSRRNEGSLLGLTNGTRVVRYPVWQLEDQVQPVIPDLLGILGNFDAWAVYLFITQESPLLDGRSPLEALRAGDRKPVLEAAKGYADALA